MLRQVDNFSCLEIQTVCYSENHCLSIFVAAHHHGHRGVIITRGESHLP